MSPMEAEGVSQEELKTVLKDRKPDELKEMGKRLTKSLADLQEMLKDLEVEQDLLRQENQQLNETIGFMMTEMQKLNIGAGNTVEPMLAEGPLNFVGRFWEKVKPRDTAVVVNEHVGEIKKPITREDGTVAPNTALTPQELGRQVQVKSRQVVERISGGLGPGFWQRAGGLVNAVQGAAQGAVQSAQGAVQSARQGVAQVAARAESARAEIGAAAAAAGYAAQPKPPVAPEAAAAAPGAAGAPEAAAQTTESPPGHEVAPLADAAGSAAEAPPTAKEAEAPSPTPAEPPQPQPDAPASAAAPAQEADQMVGSTVLIEAKIKLDDGGVQTLLVRASDRCKEVAKRFVQDHSLKGTFEAPITAWLKQAEGDAVKFPVHVEADLVDIKKQFTKTK